MIIITIIILLFIYLTVNDILEYKKHKEKINKELERKRIEAEEDIRKIKELDKIIQKINLIKKNEML